MGCIVAKRQHLPSKRSNTGQRDGSMRSAASGIREDPAGGETHCYSQLPARASPKRSRRDRRARLSATPSFHNDIVMHAPEGLEPSDPRDLSLGASPSSSWSVRLLLHACAMVHHWRAAPGEAGCLWPPSPSPPRLRRPRAPAGLAGHCASPYGRLKGGLAVVRALAVASGSVATTSPTSRTCA